MHSCVLMQNCDIVVEAIKETGQIKRGQKDLEEQVSEPRAVRRAHKNKFLINVTTKTCSDGTLQLLCVQ